MNKTSSHYINMTRNSDRLLINQISESLGGEWAAYQTGNARLLAIEAKDWERREFYLGLLEEIVSQLPNLNFANEAQNLYFFGPPDKDEVKKVWHSRDITGFLSEETCDALSQRYGVPIRTFDLRGGTLFSKRLKVDPVSLGKKGLEKSFVEAYWQLNEIDEVLGQKCKRLGRSWRWRWIPSSLESALDFFIEDEQQSAVNI